MKMDFPILFKSLSPKIASKALQAFDRATMIVVGICWAGAILMIVFAIYTLSMSVSAKHANEAAIVAEPSIPHVTRSSIDPHNAQLLVDRLQHRFPEITFSLEGGQKLIVTSIDGNKFHQWMIALSYIDTISPEYHWSIAQFCVGKCQTNELMRATLTGEKIAFEAPQQP